MIQPFGGVNPGPVALRALHELQALPLPRPVVHQSLVHVNSTISRLLLLLAHSILYVQEVLTNFIQ